MLRLFRREPAEDLTLRHGLRGSEACGLQLACDSALLSQHNTFGLHCGVWVIDGAAHQAYKVSVMASARSLSIGIGQNGR